MNSENAVRRVLGMNGLSRKATIRKADDENKLSRAGVVIEVSLFSTIMLRSPELRASFIPLFAWSMILTFAVSQMCIIFFGHRILRGRNGIRAWRIWTILNCQLIGFAWSILCCFALFKFGISTICLEIFVLCLGLSLGTSASLTFDLVNNWLFQIALLGPVIIGLAFSGFVFYALAVFLVLIYGMASGRALHREVVANIHRSEQLGQQYYSLQNSYQLINAMFESINESFILLNEDGVCVGRPSSVAKNFFPNVAEGVPLWELFQLRGAAALDLQRWYQLLFSDRLEFATIAALTNKIFEMPNGQMVLKLKYHPLRGDDGKLKTVIFVAVDITAERAAQKALEVERERAGMILRIHQNREAFRTYLLAVETAAQQLIAEATLDQLDTLKRTLHNLKGEAMLFGVESLVKRLHETELAIGTEPNGILDRSRHEGRRLQVDFACWREKEASLFTQIGLFDGETLEISQSKLQRLEREFSEDSNQQLQKQFQIIKERLYTDELGDLLGNFKAHVESTATQLGKKIVFDLHRASPPIYISPSKFREPIRALIHLFNNAIDHGMESPAERKRLGKPSEGRITIKYSRVMDAARSKIRVEIEDDGRGVDIAKIRSRLQAKGIPHLDEMNELEIASQIFLGGVSSREKKTELSGQGVGMGAVRAAVLKVRGQIRIARTGPQGTTFEIELPEPTGG